MHEFAQVRLLVDDVKACRAFYTDVMGLEVRFADPIGAYVELEAGQTALALFLRSAMQEAVGAERAGASGGDRSVVVFRVDDVDQVARELRERGARVEHPPTDRAEWGLRTAHFRDPAGNLIELIARL